MQIRQQLLADLQNSSNVHDSGKAIVAGLTTIDMIIGMNYFFIIRYFAT